MKLYKAKIPVVARDIIGQLATAGDIEIAQGAREEAELDVQSVLSEYIRLQREISDRTKDLLETRSLGHDQFGRVRRNVSEEKGMGTGDDGLGWICDQILETFMQSEHVEEVFETDMVIRRKMLDILRRHTAVDEELDAEVRQRIQNLQEGTSQWDIEYGKAMDQMKRKRGLQE